MTTTIKSHVGADGILRLEVPTGLPETEIEVTLDLRPVKRNGDGAPASDTAEFLNATFGRWQGDFPAIDRRAAFEERDSM